MDNRYPLKLIPIAKDYLWGGSRLNDDFCLGISSNPFAEAWVCSSHPDGDSDVPYFNCTLSNMLERHPDWLGSHALQITGGKKELPIIIKLIDAKQDLSIQVHPDDEYALAHECQRGKTEMWYILDAKKESQIIFGFNQDVTPELVRQSISSGSIEYYINRISVHKDDLFFVDAGTVHAIGAGTLLVEIQESSNITYRLFDYNRIDKYGKNRPLHIDKALDVANLKASTSPRQPLRVLKYQKGCASELLARCKYFQVERMLLNTEIHRDLTVLKSNISSFHALLCIEGCGSISWDDGAMNFFKGDCIFVPADSAILKLHGKAQLLNVSC